MIPPAAISSEEAARPRVPIAIAVVQRERQFLIGLRPEGVALAGYWEFPGGKVVSGETPAEGAIRECLEETGLAVRITGSYPTVDHDYPHAAVVLHFFACEPAGEVPQLPSRFRWVSAAELGDYSFPPANAALLDAIAERPSV